MKKNILITLVSFFFFSCFTHISFADSCKYTGKMNECDSALQSLIGRNKKYITPGASVKSIEDFPCLQDSPEKRIFQIAMDENFTKIDKKAEQFLEGLYEGKDTYFSEDKDVYDGVSDISKKFDELEKMYKKACHTSFEETFACTKNYAYDEGKSAVSIKNARDFISGFTTGTCYKLAEKKINIYEQISYNSLTLNKTQVDKDTRKKYEQGQRTKYDTVLDLMTRNLGYIERIWKKWPSKTKNTY